jgi:anaerobic selenocysteine-containing dehydrogenase
MTTEMIQNRASQIDSELAGLGNTIPPAFAWYYQYGYKERWNNPENNDPSMKRTFDEYITEAVEKGWWDASCSKAYQEVEPRVLYESGGNLLRRQRGGQKLLLEHLWPKLKMIVSVDYRMTTTGLYSDYVLPAAQHYEKLGHSMPSVHHLNFVLCDRAAAPVGEALPDYEIGVRIAEKLEQRAKARGMKEFTDRRGKVRSLENIAGRLTLGGAVREEDKRWNEIISDNATYGLLPKGTTLETLRGGRSVYDVGDGGPRRVPGLDDPAKRGAQPASVAYRGQDSIRYPGASCAVLHRPRVVPGSGGGAPDAQGAAAAGR